MFVDRTLKRSATGPADTPADTVESEPRVSAELVAADQDLLEALNIEEAMGFQGARR